MNIKKNVFEIITMVVFVIAVAGVLLWQNLFGPPSRRFGPGENDGDSVNGGDSDGILSTLENGGSSHSKTPVSVTKENFRAVIDSIEVPDNYTWEAVVTAFYSDKTLTRNVKLVCNAPEYRLDVTQDGRTVKSITDDGENITVTEYTPVLSSAFYPSGTSDVFSEGMLPSVYGFLNLPYDTTEFEYTLSKSSYGNTAELSFSYTLGETAFSEYYTISLDYGLVVTAKTYQGDELVYELETTKLALTDSESKEE